MICNIHFISRIQGLLIYRKNKKEAAEVVKEETLTWVHW